MTRATVTVIDPCGTFEPEEREVCVHCGKRPCQPGDVLCPLCEAEYDAAVRELRVQRLDLYS